MNIKARLIQWIVMILILAFVLGLPVSVFSQAETTQVIVEPATVTGTTCESQTIAIKVTDVSDLTGYHLEIAFDPDVIAVTDVVNGGFLDGADDEAFYEPTNEIDNVTGSISFGMVQQNTPAHPLMPKSGSGDLILITFQALVPNQTSLIDIDAENSMLVDWPNAFEIDFSASDGEVTTESCPPTDIELSKASIPENDPVGTQVGVFSSVDPDTGDSFSYSLEDDLNYPDNLSFTIVGDALITSLVLDYETQSVYTILVRTTDGGGKWFERTFTIDVEDVNEAPTAVEDTYSTLKNQPLIVLPSGVLENDLDPESDALSAFKLTDPAVGVLILSVDGSFSYHPPANWVGTTAFTYQVYDGEFYSASATVTIHVNESNQPPTDIFLDDNLVPENSGVDAAVGTLSTGDPDALDAHSYALVEGTGDDDNALFTISGSALLAAEDFNYEIRSEYSVRIRTTDQGGLTFEKAFTIYVTDENDPPVAYNLEVVTVEDMPVTFTITGFDEDGDDLEFVLLTEPLNGTMPWTPPDLTYSPALGFEGLDSFQFKVIDEHDVSSQPATVFIVADPKVEFIYFFPVFEYSGK